MMSDATIHSLTVIIRRLGLLALTLLFVSQSAGVIAAAPVSEDHGTLHAEAAAPSKCHGMDDMVAVSGPHEVCSDHDPAFHCAMSQCCAHSDRGAMVAEVCNVLTAFRHPFDRETAMTSRARAPDDRPPRLL